MVRKNNPKRHIYTSGNSKLSGPPEVEVKKGGTGEEVKCPHCNKVYKQDGRLKEHIKQRHAAEVAEQQAGQEAGGGAAAASAEPMRSSKLVTRVEAAAPLQKLPRQLLQEFCQKNKHGKPRFKPRPSGSEGFKSALFLRLVDTDSDLSFFTQEAFPTQEEAHQRAALMALHECCQHTNMVRIVPPAFKDMWKQLDVRATERAALNAEREQKRLLREQREEQRKQRELNRPKLPEIWMPENIRMAVEEAIKVMQGGSYTHQAPVGSSPELESLILDLERLGFDSRNAALAAHACGADQAAALDWLCLHLPESQLPAAFHPGTGVPFEFIPKGQKSNALVSDATSAKAAGQKQSDASPKPNPSQLLAATFGFNEARCSSAVSSCKGDAVRALWAILQEDSGLGAQTAASEDGGDAFVEEQETLSAIYGDDFSCEGRICKVRLQDLSGVVGGVTLEVSLSEGYPNCVPSLARLRAKSLDSRSQLFVTRALFETCAGLIGECMIFSLVQWLTESLESVLAQARSPIERNDAEPAGVPAADIVPDQGQQAVAGRKQQRAEPKASKTRGGRRGASTMTSEQRARLDAELLQEFQELQKRRSGSTIQRARERLPAWSSQDEVVKTVEKSQVVVLQGATGCGKTTQVPQFILDAAMGSCNGALCNILCTQPRRISAMGVAQRVASERMEEIGGSVGYQIRLETKRSGRTRLMFCTTGVCLRRLQNDPDLEGVSHVIVDEVHERSIDSDFLLILLRRLVKKRRDIKVVLMSATLDANLFSRYFGGAPVLTIPGFTHPVQELFLDDVLGLTGYQIGPSSYWAISKQAQKARKAEEKRRKAALKEIERLGRRNASGAAASVPEEDEDDDQEQGVFTPYDGMDSEEDESSSVSTLGPVDRTLSLLDQQRVNYELLEAIISHVVQSAPVKAGEPSAILVFLPGIAEITSAFNHLRRCETMSNAWLVPLHSSLPTSDQVKVFQRPPSGQRKIVLTTNIAETSVTIDDVVCVVDSGRMKENSYNPDTNMPQLVDVWVSLAAAKQRMGRAGRVLPGICYRMYSRGTSSRMSPQQAPEMHRVPLEQLCLQIKSLTDDRIQDFLSQAIEPPKPAAVLAAMATLREVGAISSKPRGKELEEVLTPLGQHLARMPVDVRLGKFLIYAAVFRCLSPALSIAATMSSKSPFAAPFEKRHEADAAKRKFVQKGECSDHLAFARAFDKFDKLSGSAASSFCRDNFLSFTSLNTIRDLRKQFVEVLQEVGFLPWKRRGGRELFPAAWDENSGNVRLLRSLLCAGLYPNLVQVRHPVATYIAAAPGSLEVPNAPKQLKFFTRDDGRVFLHPASINFDCGKFLSPFLVFHEKIQTSKVFLRDTTMVTPYTILMFCGSVEVFHEQGLVCVDGWSKFQAPARIASLVKQLRLCLDQFLSNKAADPTLELFDTPLADALIQLLAAE